MNLISFLMGEVCVALHDVQFRLSIFRDAQSEFASIYEESQ